MTIYSNCSLNYKKKFTRLTESEYQLVEFPDTCCPARLTSCVHDYNIKKTSTESRIVFFLNKNCMDQKKMNQIYKEYFGYGNACLPVRSLVPYTINCKYLPIFSPLFFFMMALLQQKKLLL